MSVPNNMLIVIIVDSKSAQKFFLAEELQAELIASPAFGSFIFESCEHGSGNISHSAAPP